MCVYDYRLVSSKVLFGRDEFFAEEKCFSTRNEMSFAVVSYVHSSHTYLLG